jgi:hypothetical protein
MDNNPIWLNDELGDVANGGGDKGKQPTYTVHSGDNLTKIAKKYNTTVEQIVKWNNIPDPNKIKVGQVIKVGPKPTQNSKPKPVPNNSKNIQKPNSQTQKTSYTGTAYGVEMSGVLGGGIGLGTGVVVDANGSYNFYFTFSGHVGLGVSIGYKEEKIYGIEGFKTSDYAGTSNSHNASLLSLSYSWGGTTGKNTGLQKTYKYGRNGSRPNKSYSGGKDALPLKGLGLGYSFSESKTWVW